jgi:hypothetical protein
MGVVPSGFMTERVLERECLDCQATLTFLTPGDATCPICGLRMAAKQEGQIGRYLPTDWEPGRIQRPSRNPK